MCKNYTNFFVNFNEELLREFKQTHGKYSKLISSVVFGWYNQLENAKKSKKTNCKYNDKRRRVSMC